VEQIMERSGFDGMQTANQALLELVQSGRVEADRALAVSLKPMELAQGLRGRQ
jgi:twitching motility protein PilT